MIKVNQIWKTSQCGTDIYLKCMEEKEDCYRFMRVGSLIFNIEDYNTGKVTKDKIWRVCDKNTIIEVSKDKDKINFFLGRSVLEEDVPAGAVFK